MKNLNFFRLNEQDQVIFPEQFCELSLDSPALNFVSDFKRHHPAVLTPSVSAMDAARVMRAGHLSSVLVLDNAGNFAGLLTVEDVSYQRVMQRVAAGASRQDLTVGDLMSPRQQLKMLDYRQVQRSSIREVLQAMRRDGQRDCLVVDLERHHVRGVICATDVAMRLHADINIDAVPTFADIFRVVSAMH